MELLCKWCKEVKPEDQFVKRVRDKPYSQLNVRCCKECNREKNLHRYHFNTVVRAKQLRANANWRKANPDRMRAHEKKFYDANPLNAKARNRIGYLVRKGFLVPQPCVVCGSSKQVEAHHDSYAEPHWEMVRWLCKDHHEKWHMIVDPIKSVELKVPVSKVSELRNKAVEVQRKIQELRNEFRMLNREADALELSAWNRVIEKTDPLFKEFLTSPRTSSGGGLEEHTTRMSPA